MTNSFIFSNARMTSSKQSKNTLHAVKNKAQNTTKWPSLFHLLQDPLPRQVYDDVVRTHPELLSEFLDFIDKRKTAR